PQDLRLAVQYAVDTGADEVADVIAQRRRIGGERAEDEVAKGIHTQLLQSMLIEAEAVWHATAPSNAAAKGDALKIAFEIVTPGVIDAGQIVGMTAPLEADEVAAMGTAVLHGVDLAILATRDDDRGLADEGCQIAARCRQFVREGQKLPGRPKKDA